MHRAGKHSLVLILLALVTAGGIQAEALPALYLEQVIEIAGSELTVIHTPGHTPGGVCFVFDDAKAVFTGDMLFAGGCGRAFGGPMSALHASLQRLAALPGESERLRRLYSETAPAEALAALDIGEAEQAHDGGWVDVVALGLVVERADRFRRVRERRVVLVDDHLGDPRGDEARVHERCEERLEAVLVGVSHLGLLQEGMATPVNRSP